MGNAYYELLSALSEQYPNLHAALSTHEHRRGVTLRLLSDELAISLRGIEQLIVYLRRLESEYHEHDATKRIAFLISRVIEDYEISVEATISGVYYVASDRMRDVLEIELLLKDFSGDARIIDTWLNANAATLRRQFSANALRQRLANRLGVKTDDLPGSGDYKAHSQLLHLAPWHARGVLLAPGGIKSTSGKDALQFLILCLGEMFFHAGPAIDAIHEVLSKLADIDYTKKHFDEHLSSFKAAYDFIIPLARGRNESHP